MAAATATVPALTGRGKEERQRLLRENEAAEAASGFQKPSAREAVKRRAEER